MGLRKSSPKHYKKCFLKSALIIHDREKNNSRSVYVLLCTSDRLSELCAAMSDCATDMAAHSQLNGYMSGIRSGNTTLVKPAGPVLQQPEWHVGEEKSFRGVSFTTGEIWAVEH